MFANNTALVSTSVDSHVHQRHLFHKAKLAPALSYSKVKGTWMKQI